MPRIHVRRKFIRRRFIRRKLRPSDPSLQTSNVIFTDYFELESYTKSLLELAHSNLKQFEDILWEHYSSSISSFMYVTYEDYFNESLGNILFKLANATEKEIICRAFIKRDICPPPWFLNQLRQEYLIKNKELSYDFFYHLISKGKLWNYAGSAASIYPAKIKALISKSKNYKLDEYIENGDPLLFSDDYFRFASFFYSEPLPIITNKLLKDGAINEVYLNEMLKLNPRNFLLLIQTWVKPETVLYSPLITSIIKNLQQEKANQVSKYIDVYFCGFINSLENNGAAIFQLLTADPSVLGTEKNKEKQIHALTKSYQAVLNYIQTLPQYELEKMLPNMKDPSSDLGMFFSQANGLSIPLPTFFKDKQADSLKKQLDVLIKRPKPNLALDSSVIQFMDKKSHIENDNDLTEIKELCKKLMDNKSSTEIYHITSTTLPNAVKNLLKSSIGEEVKANVILYMLTTIPPEALSRNILKPILPYKNTVREVIGKINESMRENLIDNALEATTTLGKFFWTKRGLLETRLTAGNLKKLSGMKNTLQKPKDVGLLP